MTINVALVTSEALVLGCDSTASRSDYYVDPFQIGLEVEVDQAGNSRDADGRMTVKVLLPPGRVTTASRPLRLAAARRGHVTGSAMV